MFVLELPSVIPSQPLDARQHYLPKTLDLGFPFELDTLLEEECDSFLSDRSECFSRATVPTYSPLDTNNAFRIMCSVFRLISKRLGSSGQMSRSAACPFEISFGVNCDHINRLLTAYYGRVSCEQVFEKGSTMTQF